MDVHPREVQSFDANDPEQVRKRQSKANRREKANRDVLANLLSTPDGRAWVWGWLESTHVFAVSFDPDPYVSAFREGERNVGLRLISQVTTVAPEAYIQMMRERADG